MHKPRHYRGGFRFAGATRDAREMRKGQTSAEDLIWTRLRNRRLHNLKFRRQHQIGKYVADFYCHEAQLVIECDGSVHEVNDQWHHDQNRDAYLISQGLKVFRFSNARILNDIESVLEEVEEYLVSRSACPIRGELIT